MVKTIKTPQRGQKQIKKEQHKIRSVFTPTDRSAGDPGRLNSRGGTRRRSSPGSPSPVSCPSSLERTKKDSQLTVFLCVGITYLPGPSPSKYFRHK